ncbi:MAG: enoyl-CoA hydratase/isomerase family protein [Bacteroidota bacterium]
MKLYKSLEYKVEDRVGTITLNRPKEQNSITDVLLIELRDALMASEQDPNVKLLILKANGKVFSSGLDSEYLQRIQNYSLEQQAADSNSMMQVLMSIYRSTKLIIAQVEGDAAGGGCSLLLAADFVFATPEARFGLPEVRIGMVPALAMMFLLRKVGETRSKELMLSGDMIDARKAWDYQLITRIIPQAEIQGYVMQFANRLCTQNSAGSMQLTKKMIADIQDFPMENAMKFAAKMNAYARATPDCKRGIQAILDKEELSW